MSIITMPVQGTIQQSILITIGLILHIEVYECLCLQVIDAARDRIHTYIIYNRCRTINLGGPGVIKERFQHCLCLQVIDSARH